jgi:NAD(P)-dependent dehydrogenase (short-subunit alcohol dehydrogenase family)
MPHATPSLSPSLSGQRVLITGGTTGVGLATAQRLAADGCRVFVCGRDPDDLAAALERVGKDGGRVHGVATDIGTEDGIRQLFAAADRWLGGLDIAILNAGIASHGELTTMSPGDCRRVIDVNLTGMVCCALEAMQRMKGSGGQIVFTGSMSAHVFDERASVYVATKAGLRGFATSLRKEANPLGIRVCLIEPGTISSDMVDETAEQQEEMIADQRMLRPGDVARAIHFMLTQPEGCDVIQLQLRPHLQLI